MSVRIDIEANISNLTAALDKVSARLGELDKKVNESKSNVGKLFDNQDSNKLLKSISSQNAELDRQRKALSDLEKYQIALYAAQKKTNDPAGIQKINAELARTKVAIKELSDKSGGSLKLIDDLKQIPVAGNSAVGTIQSLGIAIASVVSLRGLSQLAAQAVQVASSFENTRVSFEVMLGSGQKATELLGQLVREAAVTPFELGQLTEISQRLLAMGITAEELIPTIRVLGDIGAGVGVEKLPQLTLALGQVRTAGRLMGTELRQFTEAGVPLLEALATKGGKSVKQISADLSAGKIGFNQVQAALAGLTEQGGKFFGLMNKQSQTLTGLTSTLKDDYKTLLRSVGEGISEGLKDSARAADGFVKSFDPEKLREFGKAIGSAISNLTKFIGLVVPLGAGVAAATTGVTLLTAAARLFGITLATGTGPIGLIIFGLTSLITLAAQYSLQTEKLSVGQQALNDTRAEAIQLITVEKRQSDILFAIAKDETTSKEQKAAAIKKILALYPQYLKDIDTNSELLRDLDGAQKRVTEGLIDYQIKQVLAKKTTDLLTRSIELQLAKQEAQDNFAKAKAKGTSFGAALLSAATLGGIETAPVRYSNALGKINKEISDNVEQFNALSGSYDKIAEGVNKSLNGLSLNPELDFVNKQISLIQSRIREFELSLKFAIPNQAERINKEIAAANAALQGFQTRKKSIEDQALKDKQDVETAALEAKKGAAEKAAKELADAERGIRDIRTQLIADDAEREIQIEKNKYEDLIKQIREFGAKAKLSRDEINGIEASALLKHKLELIDIEAKYQLKKLNLDAGKDKVKQLQNELDVKRDSFEKGLKLEDLTDEQVRQKRIEFYKENLVLLANWVAEKESVEEKAEQKRLENLKLYNKLIGDERANAILDAQKEFDDATKTLGSLGLDPEKEAAAYAGAKQILEDKKADINKEFDKKSVEASLKSLEEQQANQNFIYEEEYKQNEIAIDRLNTSEDRKNELRSTLDKKRQLFELEQELNFINAKLKLGDKLGEDEKKQLFERIQTITDLKSQLNAQLNNPNDGKQFGNLFEALGFKKESAAEIQAFFNEATNLANGFLKEEEARAARAKEIADQKVSDLENQLSKELDLKNQGYANNYDLVQKELEGAKLAQGKALEDRKKAAKAQLALDASIQVSNMVLAASNLYKTWSSIPFGLGLIAAAAQIAGLFALIASVKNKANAINAGQFEHGGDVDASTGVLRGKRHKHGGIKFQYEAEEGEFATSDGRRLNIVNRKMTAKHFNLLNAINKDDRGGMVKSLFELTGAMRMIDIDRTIPSSSKQVIVNNQTLSVTELREIRDILKENGRGMQISDGDKVRVERSGNYTRVINK